MALEPVDGLGKSLLFAPSDLDEAGTTKYYGFVERGSSWKIIRFNTTVEELRYVRGSSNYPTAWTNRASQVYNYYNVEF